MKLAVYLDFPNSWVSAQDVISGGLCLQWLLVGLQFSGQRLRLGHGSKSTKSTQEVAQLESSEFLFVFFVFIAGVGGGVDDSIPSYLGMLFPGCCQQPRTQHPI